MSFISDLLIEISSFRIRVGNKLNALANRIGDLTALTTSNKNSLVEAVNEVNGKVKSSVWEYGINVSIANRQALRYPDNTLFTSATDDGLYEINLATTGTSTLNGSKYILRNQSGSWSIRVIRESGSSSNHPRLEIDTNGIPVVYTSHASTYAVMVSVRKYLTGTSGVVNDITFLGLDYQSIIGTPTLVNNYLDSIITTNGTTAGTIYTFKRVGLSDLTITLTPASASYSGVITTGTQIFEGVKTFNQQINTANHGNSSQWNTAYQYVNPNTLSWSTVNATDSTGHTHELSIDVFSRIRSDLNQYYDLNDIGDNYRSGFASVASQANAQTALNYPWEGGGGNLLNFNNGTTYKTQIFHNRAGTRIAYRAKVSGTTYRPWVEFITDINLDTQATSLGFIKSSALGSYVLQSSLNTQLSNYATLAGTQTFTGTNTFTQAIYTPAATLNGHAVNLGQLNTILSNYALASAIPTNNNQLINGAGYITAAALGGYVQQSSLNTQLANYASKAGTQTFTGTNTFTQAIYIPAATLNGHAVNLGQLNSILSNYATNENVAYYNDGDNVNSNVQWGSNVVGGARNQVQGGRNIVKGEDINIFGSRNVSSGINNQTNGFANVVTGAFNTLTGAYSSIAGSQANVIGNYLFARDKQTVLGMYNKVYDLGDDEGLRFAFGTGMNDLDKFNAVEIYDDHRTEHHGKATYNEETRNPEWFTEDYTHVDTYQMGYDHLTHRARHSTPCEHNIFEIAVRDNHSGAVETFVAVNNFKLAFDIHGILQGNNVESSVTRAKVHTKGTLEFSDTVRTALLTIAEVDKKPYLVVEYVFEKEEISVRYVDAFYLRSVKSQNDRIVYIIGSFINKRGASGQPDTTYFEFNQQII